MDLDFDLALKAIIAVAPVLILLFVFDRLDVFNLISFREISLLLLGGGALAGLGFLLNWLLLDGLRVGFDIHARYISPAIEECLKAAPILALFAANRLGFKIDAAIAGFAVGSGFAVVENAWFLLAAEETNVSAWLVRGLGTAVMHGGATALFAVISHEMTEGQAESAIGHYRFSPLLFVPGLGIAFLIHSTFNHFPHAPVAAMGATFLLVPVTLLLTLARSERATKQWLKADRDAHHQALMDIRSGHFAESELGRSIKHLVDRFHGATAADAFAYLELKLELVLLAEEAILASHHGETVSVGEEEREKFARLDALAHRLGKSALAAISSEFGFSRNDLWELGRLRARVRAD
jgi:RsiW-degrading membrane proteinase PrsW (M82 family)